MKATIASAALIVLCVLPAVAETETSSALHHVVKELPNHLRGLQHDALTDSSNMRQYAIANVTIGGAEESFSESAAKLHSVPTAESLLSAYRDANSSARRIDEREVNGLPVLALDEFATGPTTYDWQRLNVKHPNVKAILRLSEPARAGGYAMVRLEMISEAGPLWGSFLEFESQPNGTWKHTRAVAGSLWK